MRILFTTCFFLVLSLVCYTQSSSVRFLADDYEYAIKKAKEERKLVFVDTYASWCKPCKKQEPIFRDQSLAQFFNDHFVNVKVDMDKDIGKSLALRYSVVFLPTLMILDDNGHVKYRSDQSFSADLLTADELLKIAIKTAYPERQVASTTSAPPANVVAQPAPATNETTTTTATPKPKYRHVQHTKLPEDENRDVAIANANENVKTPSSPPTKADVNTKSGEKILYVLGEGDDVPPEVLREEAYFRLSLMDGSHREAAKTYLRTQKDWSNEENMKFLFDFLYTTRSDEFTYLIINRHKFEDLLGKERVANSIDILVNQTLDRAIPRPDRKEAQALYSYIDRFSSRKKGTKYHLTNLLHTKKIDEYISLGKEYIEDMNPSDTEVMYELSNTIAGFSDDKKSLKYAMKLIDKCIKINGSQFKLLDAKSYLYYELGDKKKANRTAILAIAEAKNRGINYDSTLELLKLIDNL